MNYYDIKRLALILAVQAEIEGMKAENANCKDCLMTYNNESFQDKASELKNLAYCHDEDL